MLDWPKRATAALVHLFRPVQDVDVYIEDDGDEAFYARLLERVQPTHARLARVFSLGGRDAVIRAAAAYQDVGRRALFIVDGDFHWVRGDPEELPRRVYRLEAYCVENLLIDERAIATVISEESCELVGKVLERLRFGDWASRSACLVDLFVVFSVATLLPSPPETVASVLQKILTTAGSGQLPELDESKVRTIREGLYAKLVSHHGQTEADRLTSNIQRRVDALRDKLLVVSGKDVLLPLVDFRMRKCHPGLRVHRRSLRMRLVKEVASERLVGLREALRVALA